MEKAGTRMVDTYEYVTVLRELIEDGKEVNILVSGSSMAPFLCHGRDYAYLRKPDRPLKSGDVVFYLRDHGQYVLHRIKKVKDGQYYIIGDNQTVVEGPVRRDQIFAVVYQIKRKGKIIKPGDFWWWFFARVWVKIVPLRRVMVKLYGKFRKFEKFHNNR